MALKRLSKTPREAYDLAILSFDGASVLRTVTVAAPLWIYVEVAQIADFGSVVSIVRIRVFQIGGLGRGTPAEETLVSV